uniref:Phosphoserine phosphatase n=1 Tax=Magnetococcus massalia (strain MO-1) TaxID=451514 RepID=A0A1S7LEP6_MAGMO|nr:Conserved protein of unknown function. Putative 3-phosphoserine phosphatase [Candidatus Magnetococcus massalia]
MRASPPTPTVVLFDLDGTLIQGDSFVSALKFLMRRRPQRLWRLPVMAWDALLFRKGLRPNHWAKERFLIHLAAGLAPHEVMQLFEPWVEQLIDRQLYPEARRALSAHKQRGEACYLVTASPAFYAHFVARKLGMDGCIATEVTLDPNGLLTGHLRGFNCYGPEKVRRIQKHFRQAQPRFIAYSDHHSDLPMLQLAQEAYAINPTDKLKELAREHGIACLHWQRLRDS